MKSFIILSACLGIALFTGHGHCQSINLITNGGFEQPTVPVNSWSGFPAPGGFAGWTVDFGAVDVVNTGFYDSATGAQSLDLNNYDTGAIYQNVTTTVGNSYRLTFSFAANPNTGPFIKRMEVRWNNSVLAVLEHDSTGDTSVHVSWRTFAYTVVGTGSDKLTFRSLTSGSAGPAIDDVSLIQLGGIQGPVANVTIERAVRICWPSQTGRLYQVQWTTDLDTDAWSDFGGAIAGNGSTQCVFDVTESIAKRFYRVLENQ